LAYNKNIPIKKSWGQNFLIDPNIINKIVELVNPVKDNLILEIGPGHGALTEKIAKKCNKLYAVEIDPLLFEKLKEKKINNLILFNEDILKWDYNNNIDKKIKIIGNLPYYISSPIIFKFLKYKHWNDMIIMLQKEVAERIVSKYNTKDYSRISVMCQTFCDIKYEMNVSRNCFFPVPKIDSAIIRLSKKNIDVNIEDYSSLIKKSFSQRRKTLKNNLKRHVNVEILKDYNLKRPQELNISDYVNLYKKIYI
tara:strand:- start:250 stop:1005 length:756 start_codon:yes stop_codon:yes gene_type:complete